MIVMAIQAAQQLANDESRPVTGYELRDVCIERALLIPPEEGGIEVMLHFRPRRLGTRSNTSTWTEFVILSQGDEGLGWQQHCSGLIMTHYREGHTPAWASVSEQAIECEHYEQRCRQVKATCTNTWDPDRFYDSLDSIGMQYGPAFRNLSEIRCSEHKAYCVARVPDIAAVMPHGFVYPHVIHTVFLESLTQMILPALTRSNKMPTQAVVGTYFESVYVSSDITTTPGDELQGYAECKWLSSRHAEGSVFVSNQDWQRPYVVIKNARLTTLATATVTEGDSPNGDDENVRKPYSQMIWKEDVDLLGKDGAKRLCSAAVASIARVDPTVFEELELAAFVIIKRTLQNFDPETAKSFAPHHRKLYEWMRHQSDLMARREVENQPGRIDWIPLDEEAANVLLRRTSERSIDGKLLYRVGQHIDAIFKGEVEALQVMQVDDLLNDMYRGGLGHPQTRAQLCAYMSCLVHKRPDINIIEIGGATANLTLPLLNTLGGRNDSSPWFASYTFTDISPEFVDKARVTLADWASNMHFQKLNIEEDPTQQGFEEGAYDVVVASNVRSPLLCRERKFPCQSFRALSHINLTGVSCYGGRR